VSEERESLLLLSLNLPGKFDIGFLVVKSCVVVRNFLFPLSCVDYLVLKPYSQHKSSITTQYAGYKPISLPTGKGTVIREEAIKTEAHSYEKCNATPNFWAYLMADGSVYSCSAYLLDQRFNLGNINDSSFRDIWEGSQREANWRFVRNELDIRDCRVNCRMDKANKYLAGFGKQEHVNFV